MIIIRNEINLFIHLVEIASGTALVERLNIAQIFKPKDLDKQNNSKNSTNEESKVKLSERK